MLGSGRRHSGRHAQAELLGMQRLIQVKVSNKNASQNATCVTMSASCANAILRCKGLGGLYLYIRAGASG